MTSGFFYPPLAALALAPIAPIAPVLAPAFALAVSPQVAGIDPTPYTAWGVLGLLGLVVIFGVLIIWRLFVTQTRFMEERDTRLMKFVGEHRQEFSASLEKVTERQSATIEQVTGTLGRSNERLARAFDRQSRALDEVLIADRALNRIAALQGTGASISQTDVESIVRELIRQRPSTDETLHDT